MASVQRTVGNQTSTVIRGVKGSTTYYISVRAYNTAGTGPPSNTVNVTTKKPRKYLIKLSVINTQVWGEWCFFFLLLLLLSAPSQPPAKVMWNTSDSKIILNWEQVKALENESEVTGYKVSNWSLGVIRKLCLLCRRTHVDLLLSSGPLQKESTQSSQCHGNQYHLRGAGSAHWWGLYHPDQAIWRGGRRQQQQADHYPTDTRSAES